MHAQRFRGLDLDLTKEGGSQLELLDERAQAGVNADLRPACAQSSFAAQAGQLPAGPPMLDPSTSPLESKHAQPPPKKIEETEAHPATRNVLAVKIKGTLHVKIFVSGQAKSGSI